MKRVFLIGFIVILFSLLLGCEQIEDTNGDSIQLQTMTLQEVAGTSTSLTSSGVSTKSTRNNFTITTMHEDIDLDLLIMKGGLLSGISGIFATYLDEGEKFKIASYCKVDSGNFAMILISPDNEIIHEFAVGAKDVFELTAMISGEYIVRIGVESFIGEISLERWLD